MRGEPTREWRATAVIWVGLSNRGSAETDQTIERVEREMYHDGSWLRHCDAGARFSAIEGPGIIGFGVEVRELQDSECQMLDLDVLHRERERLLPLVREALREWGFPVNEPALHIAVCQR